MKYECEAVRGKTCTCNCVLETANPLRRHKHIPKCEHAALLGYNWVEVREPEPELERYSHA